MQQARSMDVDQDQPELTRTSSSGESVRPNAQAFGTITLVRHGEPALSRRIRLSAAGYRDWWGRYEEGGLLEGQTPPDHLCTLAAKAAHLFCSTRRRAMETAKAVCGERVVLSDDIFIEAPLPPPNFPSFIKFSPKLWGGIARFWWYAFNHNEGQETRVQAEERARIAAARLYDLAKDGQDVMVLAHGYFNTMIGWELCRLGYRLASSEGYRYWAQRRFEKRKA